MSSKTIMNPVKNLFDYGQSVWLDYIRRSLITSGELHRMMDIDGLRGVTSNPSIFEKAIAGSTDYQDILRNPEFMTLDAKAFYERIAVRDIQEAADILHPLYETSRRRDGYVSLEVSPLLAHDTEGTVEEARRLWTTVDRKNLMVKVPATAEGLPAIRRLIGDGINVNVTLLFARAMYERVAEAYLSGLEDRIARGEDVAGIASVASFFVSRIDSAIDELITAKLNASPGWNGASMLRSLLGQAAIANAKITYQQYLRLFDSPRWARLLTKGAQTQRLLWASTSSKNPNYRDVIYVEELIGQDTVNTIPPATFNAFRDHGQPRASVTENVGAAFETMDKLATAGISMTDVTDKLLQDGLTQFVDAFHRLLKATGKKLHP